jgi:hypothetical protein
MDNSDPVFSQPVLDMFTVANEFCIFVEKAGNYPKPDVLNYLQKIFPLMYLKGALVPEVTVEYPEANERYVTVEQWQNVLNDLTVLFAEDDQFLHCDPKPGDNEPIINSFAENLADIYQDMKDFVLLYSRELHAARENAVHEIGRLFESHWGHRVLICQVHLHYLLHRGEIEEESAF